MFIVDELKKDGRNKTKDSVAWSLLYGGFAAYSAIISASGLVDQNARMYFVKETAPVKKRVWEKYQQTGDIKAMIHELIGLSDE